jgi:hypothetical protein
LFPALLALFLFHAGGCGGKAISSTLNVHSLESKRVYSQTFPRAYVSEIEGGEYDAVLLANENELISSPRRANLTGPITTSDAAPLRHVLHIRVLWRPQRGTRADTPTATNAVVNWYIRRSDTESSSDRLHYQGAGFVMVYPEDKGVSFSIRNLTVSLRDRQGDLPDPIGRARLEGNFYALRNAQAVRSILDSVRSQFAPTTASTNQSSLRTDTGTNPPKRDLGSP